MSQRERWIVYPLLFLAVLLAGFDKIFPSKTTFDEIVCKRLKAQEVVCAEMETVSIDGKARLAWIGSTPEGGGELLLSYREFPQPVVALRAGQGQGGLRAPAVECSRVIVTDDGQRSLVEIGADTNGGFVNARSRDGAWGVALMHGAAILEEQEQRTVIPISGMFGVDLQAQQPVQNDEGQLWGMQFGRPAVIIPRSMPELPAQEPQPGEEATEDSATPDTESAAEAAENEAEATQSEADANGGDDAEAAPPEPAAGQPGPADLEPAAASDESTG